MLSLDSGFTGNQYLVRHYITQHILLDVIYKLICLINIKLILKEVIIIIKRCTYWVVVVRIKILNKLWFANKVFRFPKITQNIETVAILYGIFT